MIIDINDNVYRSNMAGNTDHGIKYDTKRSRTNNCRLINHSLKNNERLDLSGSGNVAYNRIQYSEK